MRTIQNLKELERDDLDDKISTATIIWHVVVINNNNNSEAFRTLLLWLYLLSLFYYL